MAEVQRTGGIGGDELDVRGPPPPRVAPAVPLAGGQRGREHARQLRLCQEEVDEAGPRDLHLFHVTGGELERADELVGDGTRRLPQTLREEEREIRGRVAVGGIARSFQPEFGERGRTDLPRRTGKRFEQRLVRLHLSPEAFFFLFFGPSAGLAAPGLRSAAFAPPPRSLPATAPRL